MPQAVRQFSVHARHVDHHHARRLDEVSFEAAAIAYLEDFHPPVTGDGEIQVIVREVGSGHQQCFRIDTATGETSVCG